MTVEPVSIAKLTTDDQSSIDLIITGINAAIVVAQKRGTLGWASYAVPPATPLRRSIIIAVKLAFLKAGYDIRYECVDDFRSGGPTFILDW